jgi:hypothetical protein
MTMTDTLLRTAVEKAKPILDRFGILAAPARDLFDARRALTIDRPIEEVGAFLSDAARAAELFVTGEAAKVVAGTGDGTVEWEMGTRGRASAHLRHGPGGSTEVLMEVHLERPADGGRPRYADNAGVIAIRALHRAKSLIETGEAPSLAVNPAARSAPDPYGN